MSYLETLSKVKISLLSSLAEKSTFFMHIGLYLGLIAVGIARYGQFVPSGLTIIMTLLSVVLLFHGYLTQRAERRSDLESDGIFQSAWYAVVVNAVMWVMWVIATEATVSTPWHLSMMIALITGGIIGIISVKRRLYAHWAQEHLTMPHKAKLKRHESTFEELQLGDDGELPPSDDVSVIPQQYTKRN